MAKTQPQRSNLTLHVFPSITDPESTKEKGHVKNLEHKSRTDKTPSPPHAHNNTQFFPSKSF